jgi:arginine-tRNA-protein transferase
VNRFNKYIFGDTYISEAARLFPLSREQAKKRNNDFDLLERIHEGEKKHLRTHSTSETETNKSQTPPEPAHVFSVTLEPDNYTEEKYSVFENYQRIVHKEPPRKISKDGFIHFLCSSPLPRSKQRLEGRELQLGSYHQCYRIDGKLIAVGILDLLPQCVSAVYFMYHESVHDHGFGKLGAMREIALAREGGNRYWYAGFYIHSCIKMRYKGDYSPQFILDPVSYSWDPLDDEMKKKLELEKFVSLAHKRSNIGLEDGKSSAKQVGLGDELKADVAPEEVSTGNDSDDEPPVPEPSLPVFARSAPGILTRAQLLTEIDLDRIKIQIRGQEAEAIDLVGWEDEIMDNPHSIKGIIAELVATVGTELSSQMAVSFG